MERYARFYWGNWVTYCLLLALHMGESSGESVVSPVAWGGGGSCGVRRERGQDEQNLAR